MRIKKFKYYACDFETTVYEGQEYTEVWSAGLCEFYTEDVKILHSINEMYDYFINQNENCMLYFHNLKFDGTFWLSFLIDTVGLKQAYVKKSNSAFQVEWLKDNEMPNNSFKYSISDRGMWYNIIIRTNGHYIEIRDSLKLMPFSLKEIGKAFKTKHQKLDMEYEGFRYAGCVITPEEEEYLKNDVLVLKEALEYMFSEGHNKLTIGSCCLSEYKSITTKSIFEEQFPDISDIRLDPDIFGKSNADAYIRRSYKGGWCYLVKGKEKQIKHNGTTADVNSLYPSMMHSESGNVYPIGEPTFWSGNYIPLECEDKYWFIRIQTRFELKDGMLPFIQIKGSWLYKSTECLETSDIYDKTTGKYHTSYIDVEGNEQQARPILTMTMTDYKLFLEHYNVYDFEILDGCYFDTAIGIFDDYIDKYKQIKMTSTGAKRTLAKLFLNNLYGKMASNNDSSFKVAYLKDDESIGYMPVEEHNKKTAYIPVGSAITSYARNFTIRAAQKNYYGVNKRGFIYADTDSIHCDLAPNELKGIRVDDNAFCCWKLESYWDFGWFTRQKTYIEHVTHEDGEQIKEPYYNVKCAGMPDKCKDLFIKSITAHKLTKKEKEKLDNEQIEFVEAKHTLEDFKEGLKIKGKLMPKRIKGGTVLLNTYYEMRNI